MTERSDAPHGATRATQSLNNATCGACGFRYFEYDGHIISCPLCALSETAPTLPDPVSEMPDGAVEDYEASVDRVAAPNGGAELLETLEMLINGMERVAEADPTLVRFMPGLEWMPKQAREVIERHRQRN